MLGVSGDRFIIGKEVYYPFAVELHYFRVDKRYWSICFERIKKAGFRILSTAIPWNLHQDRRKDIDFTGYVDSRKDLIVFLELAREFGFKVILHPGPHIAAQWPNGGLPAFLFTDLKIFARDAKGQELKLADDCQVAGGYLPSYLHPHYQHFLRNYFKAFIESTKNYIHPRGPIFMIELDFETSFGRFLDPASADYNPDVLAKYYSAFLASTYEDIAKLNHLYREKAPDFESVEPPRVFNDLDLKELPKVFDWLRFREWMLKTYLSTLEEIFKSYTVEPLFFRSLYFRSGDLLPSFSLVPEDREIMLGSNVFPEGTYFDLAQKGRFLVGQHQFAWASSFTSGAAATERELKAGVPEYPDNLRRFYLVAGLASGFKGFNHYMFVNRDHWRGAPLSSDGTISSGYNVVRDFNAAVLDMKLYELERSVRICLLGNRQYQWMRLLKNPKQFGYVDKLMTDSVAGFSRDLLRLKLDYDIRESFDLDALKKYSLVFIPSAEFMPKAMQEAIVELLKRGVNVILCGLLPKYDENFKDSPILCRLMRIKTSLGNSIDMVKSKNVQFTSSLYGHILSTDTKVKRLAWVSKKTVGVASSRYKGTLYLFTFNIGTGGDHSKLTFLESVLADSDIVPYTYCSDPSVDVVVHKADKRAVMYVVAPPPDELPSIADASPREVVIRVDLRKVGIPSAKVKMKDLLAGEEAQAVTLTSDNLRRGITVDIDFPDGRVFLFQKK
ncbi:MAG: beta-galactosidase [Candidatus Zixiibacteriota bacterium]|nr:MAG: beta-galactosidase [candidate division Zixibacteria bacterium]